MTNSVRSHYARPELEQLFELQPRAAQKLLNMLPTVQVGTSRLVERDRLKEFLDRIHEAEDADAVILAAREEKPDVNRRKLRDLVPYDSTPVSSASLPTNMTLELGRLEVRFGTAEELADAMYFLARLMDGNLVEFMSRYVPSSTKRD